MTKQQTVTESVTLSPCHLVTLSPRRRPPLLLCLALASWALVPAPLVRAAPRWDVRRTWVFAVGVLEWKEADLFHPFPKEGRKDVELVRLFRARGVPAKQITFLKDKEATQPRIRQALVRLLR